MHRYRLQSVKTDAFVDIGADGSGVLEQNVKVVPLGNARICNSPREVADNRLFVFVICCLHVVFDVLLLVCYYVFVRCVANAASADVVRPSLFHVRMYARHAFVFATPVTRAAYAIVAIQAHTHPLLFQNSHDNLASFAWAVYYISHKPINPYRRRGCIGRQVPLFGGCEINAVHVGYLEPQAAVAVALWWALVGRKAESVKRSVSARLGRVCKSDYVGDKQTADTMGEHLATF